MTRADLKRRLVAMRTQITLLRNKAASTEFPAERDTALRIADQRTIKLAALQAEYDQTEEKRPVSTAAPKGDPLAILTEAQCHALLLTEYGFPKSFKFQIGKRTWDVLLRKKYIRFPPGLDRIVATEKGKAFLMALRKEYRFDMHALVYYDAMHPTRSAFSVSSQQWALGSVLRREMDRMEKYQHFFWTNAYILRVPAPTP